MNVAQHRERLLRAMPECAVVTTMDERQETALASRVVVVDDGVDAAESLAMLLRLTGYDVRVAHDGLTALELVDVYRPHALLLDIGLPGLNGLDVAKRIRQQPDLGSMRLVAMTGFGQSSDRRLAAEAGFDHFIVKPVDFREVRKVLDGISQRPT